MECAFEAEQIVNFFLNRVCICSIIISAYQKVQRLVIFISCCLKPDSTINFTPIDSIPLGGSAAV